NTNRQSTHRVQNRESVSQALDRVRQVAKQRKDERFTSLLHHVDVQHLTEAYYAIKHKAAPGVDGVTWKEYGEHDLELKLADLHARRQFIPKADGTQRPLAIAALEDKIVQRAVANVLEAIYEQDFLGFSYG